MKEQQPRFADRWLIPTLGALTAFGPISIDMYLPSLPSIARDMQASSGEVQLTLSAFFLGFAVSQLFYGPLSDRVGRKPILLAGIVLYILASMLCALSQQIEQLIAARFLQALGGAAGAVMTRAIARDVYSGDQVARVLSFIMLVMAMAPLLAPLIGGQLLIWGGWRPIFWLLTGFGMLCLIAVFRLPETYPEPRRRPPPVLTSYARLLAHRQVLGYVLCAALATAGMFTYIVGSPFVYIEVFGIAPEHYGFLFGLNVLGIMSAAYLNSRLVIRYGGERLLGVALLVMAGAGVLLLLAALFDVGGLWGIVIPLFFYVSMIGMNSANAVSGALAFFPALAGTVSALQGACQFGLGALAGVLLSWLPAADAVPMAALIAASGLLAVIVRYILIGGRSQ